jgi:hypothetical protein
MKTSNANWSIIFSTRKGGAMSVSKEDRKDYEEGLHDRQKGVFDQAINDVTVNHPDTEAYYKGRRGEQLDEDKD